MVFNKEECQGVGNQGAYHDRNTNDYTLVGWQKFASFKSLVEC